MMPQPRLFETDPSMVVTGESFQILSARSWVLRLPRELKTPNRTIWGDWRRLASDRNGWETAIRTALHTWRAYRELAGYAPLERLIWPLVKGHKEKRVMTIRRLVPSPRNFARDARNRQFSAKGLEDALVRQELLVDDSDAWLTAAPITEHVSRDGQFYTVILLERPRMEA